MIQVYIAIEDGWIAGRRVTAGARVMLSPEQAKYERVRPASPDEQMPAAATPRRRSSSRARKAGGAQ